MYTKCRVTDPAPDTRHPAPDKKKKMEVFKHNSPPEFTFYDFIVKYPPNTEEIILVTFLHEHQLNHKCQSLF